MRISFAISLLRLIISQKLPFGTSRFIFLFSIIFLVFLLSLFSMFLGLLQYCFCDLITASVIELINISSLGGIHWFRVINYSYFQALLAIPNLFITMTFVTFRLRPGIKKSISILVFPSWLGLIHLLCGFL